METLIASVKRILTEQGRLCLILPLQNETKLIGLLREHKLYMNRILKVYPTPEKKVSRCCYEISAGKKELFVEELVIETGKRHQYSSEYKVLTEPFYL
jgi:tRNA1Val (adenine37-N6)-methyltransferase